MKNRLLHSRFIGSLLTIVLVASLSLAQTPGLAPRSAHGAVFPSNAERNTLFILTAGTPTLYICNNSPCMVTGDWVGVGSASTGNMSTTPTGNQNVIQPPGTSLTANIFNNAYYVPARGLAQTANGDNWTQSPSSPSSISAGLVTVTLSSCPPGLLTNNLGSMYTAHNWTAIQVGGTGATEYPFLSATSCPPQGSAAGGTITFTAANSHSAGYTVGTASQGLQEAINAGIRNTMPGTYGYEVGSENLVVPPGDYTANATVSALQVYGNSSFHFDGVTITCAMQATCLRAGDSSTLGYATNMDFYNLVFRPGVVAGYYPAFEDDGMHVRVHGIGGIQGLNYGSITGMSFGALEQVDYDEAFLIDGMNTQVGGAGWQHCSTDFVSNAIYITNNATAPTGAIENSNLQMGGCGNGIDNWGMNGLRVSNVQIQAFNQFGIRSTQTYFDNANLQADNVYEEVTSTTNPLATGQSGLAAAGGTVFIGANQGGWSGKVPLYANTGSTQYNYSIVIKSGADASPPYISGYALTNGSGSITVTWPEAGSTGTITYDVLRSSGTSPHGLYTAICGGGSPTTCGSIATGVTTASCSNNVCSITDTASANTSAYKILASPTYYPWLIGTHGTGCGAGNCGVPPWPGTLTLSGAENANINSISFARVVSGSLSLNALGQSGPPVGIVQAAGAAIPTVVAQQCDTGGIWSPVWIVCSNDDSDQYAAQLMQVGGFTGGPIYGIQGKQIFTGAPGSAYQARDIITVLNCHPEITLTDPSSTLYARTPWNACDNAIGLDNAAGNFAANLGQLAFRSGVSLSRYVNNVGDNVNWLERLTANLDTYKVPVSGKRIDLNQATTLVAGDFALGAGWGSTAATAITLATSKDQVSVTTITAAGTGITANPTYAITFHDGTWTQVPGCSAVQTGGTGAVGALTVTSRSATSYTFQWAGTPSAGLTYEITIQCLGT